MPSIIQLYMAPASTLAPVISFANIEDEESDDEEDISTPVFGSNNDGAEDKKYDNEKNEY